MSRDGLATCCWSGSYRGHTAAQARVRLRVPLLTRRHVPVTWPGAFAATQMPVDAPTPLDAWCGPERTSRARLGEGLPDDGGGSVT